jgi:hypothetical protein
MIALQNMRMSCNSTYLLDQKTDHGVKADELISVLQESFERPNDKAVVFSQWFRTHELILDRLESAKLGYVLFHGRVASKNRRELIRQFKQDADCRVFLSTDAGGVGLNLQNASTVVNMDLPWNPAVLNQRIGRVHRLGQHRPVRVVNFVAQGTIEHSMLSVLAFKQSVFAGVLDGGRDEVFLGGTRLKRFMDSVDKVTQAIPQSMPPQAEAKEPAPETAPEAEPVAAVAPAQPDWAELLSAGLSFLDKLGRTSAVGAKAPSQARPKVEIETDASTGQQHLKLPVPSKEVLQGLANFLNEVAGKL